MKLLLHTCCAPCLLYPWKILNNTYSVVTPYFYNPNIHPFLEYKKRRNCLVDYLTKNEIEAVIEDDYGYVEFTRIVAFNEKKRCELCYVMRLKKTAEYAAFNGFSSFSSTLLYSKYQKHNLIRAVCEKFSKKFSVKFDYLDYRSGWQEGIDGSIAAGLYRQPYCGCIYSERERYDNKLKKRLKKDSCSIKGEDSG